MSHDLFDTHKKTLDAAVAALASRTYWSAYPEAPSGKIYGETARDDGLQAFQARLGKPFRIDQPGGTGQVGAERSPYGLPLEITYPMCDPGALVVAATAAMPAWRDAGVKARVGVCLEILDRLNRRSFEIANAVMHTTGQGFMMAFQAGGPHAQDRGLEAVARAYQEMSLVPEAVTWEKQVSKTDVVRLHKRYRLLPRGVALMIGCSTFPTWNGYPGLFASLVTGNPVIVKPHPGAVLPLAITVEVAREVLREAGFDANLVTLAADTHDAPITQAIAERREIAIIDYTGGSDFGSWLEKNCTHASVYTEKAGVNSVILDSAADLKAVTGNLAFSLCLYSGQMCTTPQNIFIPAGGIRAGGEKISFDDAAGAIVKGVNWLLSDPARASEVLGAIASEQTVARIDAAAKDEAVEVLRPSGPVENASFPGARTRSPLILKTTADNRVVFSREMFGPIAYVIATKDTAQSIELAAACARGCGAITGAVYSTDDAVLTAAESALTAAGVPVSCNLTGQIWVNQSAAFSDFHVSGSNPAGNATLCDAAFVASRFRWVQSRRPVTA